MSNYALGAIQMLTPSTFRRRNVSTRTTNAVTNTTRNALQLRNSRLAKKKKNSHHHRSIKNAHYNTVAKKPSSSTLPNTLTFYEQKSTTGDSSSSWGNNNNNNNNNNNYPMSQLTMSQLSDSKSHQQYNHHHHHNRSISNQTQTRNQNYHEERPSKVARTTVQNRPSASLVRRLQSDDNVSISSGNYGSRNSNKNESSNIESRRGEKEMANRDRDRDDNGHGDDGGVDYSCSQPRSQHLLPHQQSNRVSSSALRTQSRSQSRPLPDQLALSQPRFDTGDVHEHDDEDSYTDARLVSKNSTVQELQLQHPNRHQQNISTSTSTSTPAPNTRKRSWMEACIDVMKTPYRKGKSIAHSVAVSMTKPMIKVDNDNSDEMEAYVQAMKNKEEEEEGRLMTSATAMTTTATTNPVSSFETPFRYGRNNKDVSSVRGIANVTNSHQGSVATTAATAIAASNEARKLLQEARDIWTKIEAAKLDIESKHRVFQDAKESSLQEIRKEKEALQKKKDELVEAIQNEVKVIHDSFEEKKKKFDVHFWSAEEKMNAKVREFDVQKMEALDGIKATQVDAMDNLKAEGETFVQKLETGLLSLDEAGKGIMDEVEAKKNECGNILKELQGIRKSVEPILMTSLRASMAAMVEDEKRKVGSYMKKELHRRMKGREAPQVEKKEMVRKKCPIASTVTSEAALFTQDDTNEKISAGSKSQNRSDLHPTSSKASEVKAKRVSPIQSVSSDEFGKNEEVCTVGASLPQTKFSSSSTQEKNSPTAVDENACTENKKLVISCGEEEATSSLPPSSKEVFHRQSREGAPNHARRYNLRSNVAASSRVGIAGSNSEVGKNISNDCHGTAKTKKFTTKKKVTKRQSKSSSHKKDISQIIKSKSTTCTSESEYNKGNNSTDNSKMTVPHTPTQAPNKVSTKQRIRRRRRIGGGQKAPSYRVITKDNSRSKAAPLQNSSNSRTVVNNLRTSSRSQDRIPGNNSAFHSPNYILTNASSRGRQEMRQAPSNSPSGVESIFGPPPIPTLDGLASTPTNFIAPRPSFMSQFDFDTLSFQ